MAEVEIKEPQDGHIKHTQKQNKKSEYGVLAETCS